MTVYLDPSALLKRYVEESDSDRFAEILDTDDRWLTARITWVEIHRNLGLRVPPAALTRLRGAFEADWRAMAIVEIDDPLCIDAAAIAEATGTRTLDAIHLAAARRSGLAGMSFVTADLRQAQAARSLGLVTLGS